ncbi:DUF1287 domain-containing protein [Flavobacterium sp.]|uniref:DUF1287 domain-containing protein n=1 Tax=Flavobacterium sp. TaxID=239 RepID=UPI0039C856E7
MFQKQQYILKNLIFKNKFSQNEIIATYSSYFSFRVSKKNQKLSHIGIVTNKKSKDGKRNLIVHNLGGGKVLEDCLFDYKIVGHFKYEGTSN